MEFIFSQGFSDKLITFLASFLIWILYFSFLLLFYLGKTIKKVFFFSLISSLLAWILSWMFKSLLPTLRPFLLEGLVPLTLTVTYDSSFPSGHSAFAFGLSTAIFLFNKKLGVIYFFLSFLVAVGRVLGKVHFWVDVLGGMILGIFSALLIDYILFRKRRGKSKK